MLDGTAARLFALFLSKLLSARNDSDVLLCYMKGLVTLLKH